MDDHSPPNTDNSGRLCAPAVLQPMNPVFRSLQGDHVDSAAECYSSMAASRRIWSSQRQRGEKRSLPILASVADREVGYTDFGEMMRLYIVTAFAFLTTALY